MRFGIVSRPDNEEVLKYAEEFGAFISGRGHEVIFEKKTADALSLDGGVLFSAIDTDIIVVIGGDGSVLRCVREISRQIPLLCINKGHVGFLSELEPDEAREQFEKIESGNYSLEERLRLSVKVDGYNVGEALNEAVIVTSRPAKILEFTINVDYVPAERFRADGVLISTPTGSTGYAMSAGGPIVDPFIECFLVVPLAPYHLSSRPHLISIERRVGVELDSPKPADLVIDGELIMELYNGNVVTVEKSDDPALFINLGKNFFAKVDSKLKSV